MLMDRNSELQLDLIKTAAAMAPSASKELQNMCRE